MNCTMFQIAYALTLFGCIIISFITGHYVVGMFLTIIAVLVEV